MRKLIAAINMTIDGFCDHTVMVADDELHRHYQQLLENAGAILYGRITYQLMLYWEGIVKHPTGNKAIDDFAVAIETVPKIVFSKTLRDTGWKNARLASRTPSEEVAALKQQEGKDLYVGSPGLISTLTQQGCIDEYQLCVHPVIAGSGLPLFKDISEKLLLKFSMTKTFDSGAVIHYYAAGN